MAIISLYIRGKAYESTHSHDVAALVKEARAIMAHDRGSTIDYIILDGREIPDGIIIFPDGKPLRWTDQSPLPEYGDDK